MSTEPLLQSAEAAGAIRALLPILADLTAAAADLCASTDVVTRSDEIAEICRDAAVLADAVTVINRRAPA